MLGTTKAGERFAIDTKWMGGVSPGWATRDNIVNSAKESIKKLGVSHVDVFYIHWPDTQTLISETLAGVQEVYQLDF
jgi:aryl-alcohol dehydrogenase-like predicted oxidoreductase